MFLRTICKSKIHRATVTDTDINYVGSITIDAELLTLSDIVPGERVSVWNIANGERFETYAVTAPAGSGQIVVNGAAARLCQKGDIVIIVAFAVTDEMVRPKMIQVDGANKFVGELVDGRIEKPVGSEF
jgi:aspartate 1-decarboxylase